MVGVPGKYKGCETCRRRRVKCTNERPKCSKCITSGRECEGYEREMMFITGTPENKGRVSSHPKKGSGSSPASSSTSKRRSKSRTPIGKESNRSSSASFVPTYPLTSAWDDFIGLSSNGTESQVLFTALQTPLKSVIREEDDSGDDARFKVSFVPTTPPELPSLPGCDDFSVQAHCLVSTHYPGEEANGGDFCAFLFEHTFQTQGFPTFNNTNPDPVQSAGPENFKAFPNHHYFVRVYRPLVLSSALLRRQPTFLSEPLWQTVPWELYPKPLFDQLLDLIALLSGTLHHTDQIMTMQPTLPRRHQAQDLLHTCLLLEARFDEWLGLAHNQTGEQPVSYWAGELLTSNGEVAFAHSYSFKDSLTGLMFLYYWMSQIRFRRCVDCLHRVIYEPVVDSYADIWPDLPPNLQIDLTRYQQTRDLAASICRGLESTLESTVQPNLLLAPMTIALELYRDINLATQDCLPEILWLEAFESRLVEKVENVAAVLQQNRWVEVTRF